MRKIKAAWSRIRRASSHTEFLFGCFVGALVGAATAGLPLFPYALPDSVATLLGAALGAAIAVFGARMAAERTETRYSIELINAAHEALQPLVEASTELLQRISEFEGTGKPMHSGHKVRFANVKEMAVQMRRELAQLKPAFDRKPDFLISYLSMDNSVLRLTHALENFERDDAVREKYAKHIKNASAERPPAFWDGPVATSVSTGEIRLRIQDVAWSLKRIDGLA